MPRVDNTPHSLNYQRILTLRRGHGVARHHTYPIIRPETVGHHSAGACAIAMVLTGGTCSANVLKYLIMHDIHEQTLGDMPANAKWAFPPLSLQMDSAENEMRRGDLLEWPALTMEEVRLCKTCDGLDLAFRCLEEIQLGNTYAEEVYWRIIGNLSHHGVHSAAFPLIQGLSHVKFT